MGAGLGGRAAGDRCDAACTELLLGAGEEARGRDHSGGRRISLRDKPIGADVARPCRPEARGEVRRLQHRRVQQRADRRQRPDQQTGGDLSHENKTARTAAVRRGETVNAGALTAMFKAIIANNQAGGWRKLKRDREVRAG